MTTYQRLKAENKELKRQLLILTQQPESGEAVLIKMQWQMMAVIENTIMAGDTDNNTTTATGILKKVTN